jgi:hypothetical protein
VCPVPPLTFGVRKCILSKTLDLNYRFRVPAEAGHHVK